MKIIGLTGPSGGGKSTISSMAKSIGISVIDCDNLAREVTEKGSDTLLVLAKNFGEDIIFSDGTLDRKLLASRAFVSFDKTELLNSIMLPAIAKLVEKEIERLETLGVKTTILDAPTLFESGLNSICDLVIAVLCSEEKRMLRIIERDNLTIEQAKVRLTAAKSDEFYREKADIIIMNDGDVDELLDRARSIFETLGE